MKSTRRVMSSAAIVAIIAFVCLLALPSLAVARTIKGHIVDVVAENIGNITVSVLTVTVILPMFSATTSTMCPLIVLATASDGNASKHTKAMMATIAADDTMRLVDFMTCPPCSRFVYPKPIKLSTCPATTTHDQDFVRLASSLICGRQAGQRQSRKAEPIVVNCDSFSRT